METILIAVIIIAVLYASTRSKPKAKKDFKGGKEFEKGGKVDKK